MIMMFYIVKERSLGNLSHIIKLKMFLVINKKKKKKFTHVVRMQPNFQLKLLNFNVSNFLHDLA